MDNAPANNPEKTSWAISVLTALVSLTRVIDRLENQLAALQSGFLEANAWYDCGGHRWVPHSALAAKQDAEMQTDEAGSLVASAPPLAAPTAERTAVLQKKNEAGSQAASALPLAVAAEK